ncbi:glycerol-3-phosphate 1-O-acyltransferase PlsB [Psychrobacter sp. FDAARGOS_221]|uniref:glycerol-3-phosphate 1-O-acyltransferase PlsB n=1 Tax=Psychrobacter sp. FDAARGOS_221 TaxID=1975705 RepID=UPI000BB59379|nr:glycerol-3-phosphate 1-O-acyltransferase PlsB [Psychrobacter sp. FDAARGOS_221]PNK60568.1 glycerol-3-phosphate 1-O-acyltransferase PlsB [Psychrobacter sp. FDAARGOS_221]
MLPSRLLHSLKERLKKQRQTQKTNKETRSESQRSALSFQEQAAQAGAAISRSGRSVNQLYHKLSGQTLELAVKPKVIGDLPEISNEEGALTFYVLREYSRSNSILVDLQSKEHGFPPALVGVEDPAHQIDENAAIIFLHHPNADGRKVSPRLARLVSACRQHPGLKINLVPVSILWGRAPDNEDSLFKLLMADNWDEPSITKQLFNIGVMGRDTFVQFHQPQSLHDIIEQLAVPTSTVNQPLDDSTQQTVSDLLSADSLQDSQSKQDDASAATIAENDLLRQAKLNIEAQALSSSTALLTATEANFSLSLLVQHKLNAYLDSHRQSMIGPDLSDKRNLVDKLIRSPAINHACQKEAEAEDIDFNVARQRARGYANEIVNDYSYSVIRFFERFLTWLWTQLYDGVEVHHFERVRELAATHELIYVPCHRSHVDYLLLAYIIYKKGLSLPYVAAGNNLDVPVLGPLLRNAIAFYIRRSFKDNELYKAVLREYLHMLIQRNTPIEYFIEGGRSRSGRLLPPKLGMLAMTVHSHLRGSNKPLAFIPTYIGYERIMEGGTYIGELKGKPKESESLLGLLKVSRKIERIFGHVHLSFGTPLHMEDFMQKFDVAPNSVPADRTDTPLDANATAMVDNLGVKIMQNINKAAVVNPISLLSLVLLSTPKAALDEESCREQIALYQRIAKDSPYADETIVTDMAPQSIIDYGIKLKLVERTPHILGDMIKVLPKQMAILSYFRNNILHVYIIASFLAALVYRNGRIERKHLDSIVTLLYPFLQSELFLYRAARNLPTLIEETLSTLIQQNIIVDLGHNILSTPEKNSEQYQQLDMLASPVSQSLERYFMSLALLAQQGSGKLTAEQVVDLCHLLGQRLSVLYSDDIPDFFDRALFTSFLNALIRLDYVQKDAETGVLTFDERINNIAGHAHYILNPDMMQILEHVASLEEEEINHAISEINNKKLSKFSRKPK